MWASRKPSSHPGEVKQKPQQEQMYFRRLRGKSRALRETASCSHHSWLSLIPGVSLAVTPERWGSNSEPWNIVLATERSEQVECTQKAKQGCTDMTPR